MKAGRGWIFLRLVAIAVVTVSLLSIPVALSNLDWGAGVLEGLVVAVGLWLWLTVVRMRPNVDLSLPYSFRQPFLPMMRFPLRYWIVVSYSLIIGGAVLAGKSLIEGHERSGVGGSVLILGLFMGGALAVWIRTFARPVGGPKE